MEDDDYVPVDAKAFYSGYGSSRALSPEIKKEDSRTSKVTAGSTSRDIVVNEVYVAVGKDDTDVLQWALDNAVSPGTRVLLVHVFPPVTHIPTPGRLAKSQLNEEQVRLYITEERCKRSSLLQNYVNLCNDSKVTVDTILLQSNSTAKAILDLIPAHSITHLVIGTKRPPYSRRKKKKLSMGEFLKQNVPDFCEVSIVHEGKKVGDNQQVKGPTIPKNTSHSKKSIFTFFPDSAWEDQDFLSSNRKGSASDRDETNTATNYGKWQGHRLKFVKEIMKWETRKLAAQDALPL